MKLSVSLSPDDVAVLDEYARSAGLASARPTLSTSILGHANLEDDYAAAWDEWESSGAREAWEATTGDGLTQADATR